MKPTNLLLTVLGILNCFISVAQHREGNQPNLSLPAIHLGRAHAISWQESPLQLPGQETIIAYKENQKIVEGSTRNHRLHGSWQSWYPDGSRLDSGTFNQGIPDGEWRQWDRDGRLIAIRNYDADKTERVRNEMKLLHPKQNAYPITELYKQDRAAASRFLSADYSFPVKGKRSANLSPAAFVELNHDPDQGYQPPFETCLHHGLLMNFFATGEVRDSGNYQNGLPEGIWLHRNSPGGSFWTGAYKNARRWQEWKKFSASGKLMLVVFYNRRGEREWSREINSLPE